MALWAIIFAALQSQGCGEGDGEEGRTAAPHRAALTNGKLAPRVGFEPTASRLTAEMIENLSALSGVAYEKLGAIFPSLVAPTPAPTRHMQSAKALLPLVVNQQYE